MIPQAAAVSVDVTTSISTWYGHDCGILADFVSPGYPQGLSPYSHTASRSGNDCIASLHSIPLHNLDDSVNMTAAAIHLEVASDAVLQCTLLGFGDTGHAPVLPAPATLATFSCGGVSEIDAYEVSISSRIPALLAGIDGGDKLRSYMLVPALPADGSQRLYRMALHLEAAAGLNCMHIPATQYCGFFDTPWEAVKKVLGEDYIGDWFYVLVFLPIPTTVYLSTRNGAYAGFVGMGIMLTIQLIDRVIFEVSLSMMLIASGFLFYEVLRKRIFD